MNTERFSNQTLAWCRIASLLDQTETRAADALGTLPIGTPEIPVEHRERIAGDVMLDLLRLGLGQVK